MAWEIETYRDVALMRMNSNKVNCQNERFFADMEEALDRLERDHAGRPLVLASAGKVFSAGFDFNYWFPPIQAGDEDAVGASYHRFKKINERLFTLGRPTVAAVNGHAYAGGLITALCCDWRIAVRGDYRFGLNELAIGLAMPAHFTEIIRYALGTRCAKELILRARMYGAEEALEMGILDALVPEDELIDAAAKRAGELGPDSMPAYAFSKRALQAPALRRMAQDSAAVDADFAATWCAPEAQRSTRRAQERLKQR